MRGRAIVMFGFVVLAGLVFGQGGADAIWLNGNIYTGDSARPRAEALAVRDGKVLAVGSEREVAALVGADAERQDLGGRTVLPGLIDAHGHLGGLGAYGLGQLDLSRVASYEELVATVAERAREIRGRGGKEWVLGGRWDHESWPDKTLPLHGKLSEAVPDVPVWLTRVDGHAGLANAAAMKIAGVTRATASPPGGEVIKDARGEPTGVFVDNAEMLIGRVAGGGGATAEQLLLKAQEMCLAAGLTGVHDAGVSPDEIAVMKRLEHEGRLKLRIYAMVNGAQAPGYFADHGLTIGAAIGDRLTVRSCKLYVDGAMGSRGAWLLAPYSDRATDNAGQPYTGLALTPPEQLRTVIEDALARGYQVCTHAIGDRGNREMLDLYEAALQQRAGAGQPRPDHRFRIEHAQLLHPLDIPRFAGLGVIPSMQPTHCTSDMRWVEQRVGPERAAGAYAWASLLRTGARIAAGSDFPVESHNPMLGLYAAVTRQDDTGQPAVGWRASERMTRAEALRAFTLDAAYAGFAEAQCGSLTPGKWADFIVLDRDVMTCEPADIRTAAVLRTVIAGETVYAKP